MSKSLREVGWWLAGAAYPWKSLHDAGYVVDFVYPFDANPLIVAYEDCDEVIKELKFRI